MSDEIKKYMKELKEEFSKENLKLKEEFSKENLKFKEEISKENLKFKEEVSKENLKFKEEIVNGNLKLAEDFQHKLDLTKAEISEETKRHMGVLAEDYQHKLDIVVEGHQVLNKKIDDLREEVRADIKEVKDLLKLTYSELDKKDRAIESECGKLRTRIENLEAAHP